MRFAALLFVLALAPAGAQIQIPPAAPSSVAAKPAAGTVGGEHSPMAVATLTAVEKDINGHLAAVGGADHPCVVLGRGTRGLYVTGFGAVFAVDLDLINTPAVGPFRTTISPEEKALVHKRKVANLALLETSMREVVAALAQSPLLRSMPGTDQIVLGVRVMCAPWEDTSGLPGQIVIRADRQGGNIRTELQ
jgi:hypothetical protein